MELLIENNRQISFFQYKSRRIYDIAMEEGRKRRRKRRVLLQFNSKRKNKDLQIGIILRIAISYGASYRE